MTFDKFTGNSKNMTYNGPHTISMTSELGRSLSFAASETRLISVPLIKSDMGVQICEKEKLKKQE